MSVGVVWVWVWRHFLLFHVWQPVASPLLGDVSIVPQWLSRVSRAAVSRTKAHACTHACPQASTHARAHARTGTHTQTHPAALALPSENAILGALREDPAAAALVDEFFLELHVKFQPMLMYWGNSVDPNKSLADAFRLFHELRQAGWRAHSWV